MLVDRIAQFVREPDDGSFDGLALAAFAYQHERIEPYRRLCRERGAEPGSISRWQDVPPVPTLAFKTLELAAAPPREVFRSSGTTGQARSVHHHPFPELYRTVIDASFPASCLRGPGRPPMLSLIPGREQLPDSSLAFMIDHVLDRFGDPQSRGCFGPRGVDLKASRSFLAARQRDRRPTLLLATSFALVQLLEGLERLGLRFRLPVGSTLFETGGTKGRSRELAREELLSALDDRLGLAPTAVVREYGMTELTSQCYSRTLAGGDPDLFHPPPWMRVRILDPESLQENPEGRPGLVALFDLANLGSAVHLLTEDLGIAQRGGFRLVGRAAGAELRGCSLVVEELAG